MTSSAKIQLRIPSQDLEQLTFVGATPKQLSEWISALPKVNVGETSRQLYSVIQEINRFKTDTKNRYLLLEELRGPIHYVCKALGKHFLNQSIVLPEKESKIANLAQALQNHLATGYKVVLIETLSQRNSEIAKIRSLAAHRAVTELSNNLLRCYQLYYPTPVDLWRELHQLFLIGQHYKILDYVISDKESDNSTTLRDNYLRTLLLATARPNQLRQKEIADIFKATAGWAQHCKLKDSSERAEPFVVNLASDEGPLHSQWKDGDRELGDTDKYIYLAELAQRLNQTLKERKKANEGGGLIIINGLPETVLRHVIQSWSATAHRSFARTPAEGKIHMAFGLGAVHHYISGKQDFNASLLAEGETPSTLNMDGETNPFLQGPVGLKSEKYKDEMRGSGDVWSFQSTSTQTDQEYALGDLENIGTSVGATFKTENKKVQTLFPDYECDLADTSPGGYCIQWDGAAPQQLKTGELLAIRENNQNTWSIAVIRWIKKLSSINVRIGVELLAPHAEACGARVVQKTGNMTEFMRSIRLPELKAIGQESTLITPQLTFKTGYKVVINIAGQEARVQLLKEVAVTASFSQFEYKILGNGIQTAEKQTITDKDEFSSLWTSI